ncbi:MAG: methionine--tRNA ligase [Candidatus Omnitrophica bacterium]|nr:methionine--tRNA ligase [Candidatus Omnitrophota bacterium]
MKKRKTYITTPLYYVNAKPHIGHSYTQIICDAVSRFRKQCGEEVFFMTGTDEHGEKIEKATLEAGFEKGQEKKFVDTIVPHFKELWKKLDIEYDRFIRTTDGVHEETVKRVLSILYEKGKIYKKLYKGWFCTPCEMFWSHVHAPDGICPDCKRNLDKLDEENYFFKTSEYQNVLIKHIKETNGFIIPDIRKNEVLSFLEKNELQDLCISRPKTRLSWGIELPFDKNFVTYVWFDALLNYISGIGYLDDRKRFDSLWPHAINVIGKDILRHHAIYWPIMLLAIDEKPPKCVCTHGWWMTEGEKMSKSKGNIVDPLKIIAKYGVDAFRYYLLSAVPFGYDGTFSEKLFIERYNNDLANDLGNLLNRTLTMLDNYFEKIIPEVKLPCDKDMKSAIKNLPGEFGAFFTHFNSSFALKAIWSLVKKANKHIEDKAPWKLAKENKEELRAVMYELIQAIGIIAVLLYSSMPDTARKMWKQLGMKSDIASVNIRMPNRSEKEEKFWGIIPSGTKTAKGKPLFPRILLK